MVNRIILIFFLVAGVIFFGLLTLLNLSTPNEGGLDALGGSKFGGEGFTSRVNISSGATGTVLAAGTGKGILPVCNDSTIGVILYCTYGGNATSGQGIPLRIASSTYAKVCEDVDRDRWAGAFTCFSLGGAATATVGGF